MTTTRTVKHSYDQDQIYITGTVLIDYETRQPLVANPGEWDQVDFLLTPKGVSEAMRLHFDGDPARAVMPRECTLIIPIADKSDVLPPDLPADDADAPGQDDEQPQTERAELLGELADLLRDESLGFLRALARGMREDAAKRTTASAAEPADTYPYDDGDPVGTTPLSYIMDAIIDVLSWLDEDRVLHMSKTGEIDSYAYEALRLIEAFDGELAVVPGRRHATIANSEANATVPSAQTTALDRMRNVGWLEVRRDRYAVTDAGRVLLVEYRRRYRQVRERPNAA